MSLTMGKENFRKELWSWSNGQLARHNPNLTTILN